MAIVSLEVIREEAGLWDESRKIRHFFRKYKQLTANDLRACTTDNDEVKPFSKMSFELDIINFDNSIA